MPTKFKRSCLLAAVCLIALAVLPFSGHAQNFPPLSFVIEDSSATQGYYFMIPYSNSPPFTYDRPLMILDQYGRILFYRLFPESPNTTPAIDFTLQPDGRISYLNTSRDKHYLMDSTFTVVDSIACVNGFPTDQHDFQVLPNHHYLLLGQETRIMNLTSYHWFGINHTTPGGANAEVTGVVIQEFDENKVLVWEWKGHDHYQFGDVNQVWLSGPNKVDWTHANAVERDNDGNILLSLRHFNEITKIDHTTGNIIWRLGGKQNQFTFPNDTIGFTGQHDIRRVSPTAISFFDNGQYTTPQMSRALEFTLDETNKIATRTWEYIYDSSMYSLACGNHQYIANGNHLVDFGFNNHAYPWMVVVRPDKSKVMEVYCQGGYSSYRAFNYITLPWQLNQPPVDCQKIGSDYFLVAEPGHPSYRWSTGETTSSIRITSPGDYWVFVPYGTGYISSAHIYITDISNPCLYLGAPPAPLPAALSLECMPNPASGQVRVVFGLPANSVISLSLISLMGTEMQKPVRGTYPAGKHEVTLDVTSLAGGIYLLTMTTGNEKVVRKVVIK